MDDTRVKKPLLMDLENNVYLEGDSLVIIDRRRLPRDVVPVYCVNYEEVARAIEKMVVQGAGSIAVTAGFGLYLAAQELERKGGSACEMVDLQGAADRLKATRPTGFHLAVLLDKALDLVKKEKKRPASVVIREFLDQVLIRRRDTSQATGKHAEALLCSGDTVLTHCFAGSGLLYMLQYARDNGKEIRVMCTETRPYLQGARLTAWSVSQLGLDTTLITDNMAAHFMSLGMIDKIFTAADRIAMDGTVANKVGTLQLAICAKFYDIPVYILGYGGPDRRTKRGSEIPIEERSPQEVLEFQGTPISGPDVKALYPAFDLTPPHLITGIITASGVQLCE
jgi:methylthioribose-1-phosphate isomerase